jgi:cyclic pyranopterin phosphate synthase
MTVTDRLGRPPRDLRISVTDRCNFRCPYCMPKEVFGRDFAFLHREELLTFEEITRLARIFVHNGVSKIRLTGGEPLLRRDLERLIEQLSALDVQDIALTTNGSLLTHEKARALKAAGLHRVTVSLDSLDDATFRAMNDVDFPVDRVLASIDAAEAAGLTPIKIDCVVKRGMNDEQLVDLAERFRGTPHIVRFIEYMDVGNTNGWRMEDVVSGREILETLRRRWELMPAEPHYFGEVAERWHYADGAGEIGIITSVTQPFCGSCTRARLAADGRMYLCLFASTGHDFRGMLRGGASDEEIEAAIRTMWRNREDRYSEQRSEATPSLKKVEMSHIGG